MINITSMTHSVVKLENKHGDRISAYLVEIIDGKYLHLRFKSGTHAYQAIDDIVFISPVKTQPKQVF